MHARRAEIDWRVAFPVINLTEIAQQFGVSRYGLQSHRRHHLPGCLATFQAWADAGRLNDQRRHVYELYMRALNALAAAERGALAAVTNDGQGAPTVSMTTIVYKIRDARAHLDQLALLAADATAHDERSQNIASAALAERIRKEQLRLTSQATQSDHNQ